jgi:hypothetical protein
VQLALERDPCASVLRISAPAWPHGEFALRLRIRSRESQAHFPYQQQVIPACAGLLDRTGLPACRRGRRRADTLGASLYTSGTAEPSPEQRRSAMDLFFFKKKEAMEPFGLAFSCTHPLPTQPLAATASIDPAGPGFFALDPPPMTLS